MFAVSQLSRKLLDGLTWRGAAETAVLLLAVMAVWLYTSWAATIIPVTQRSSRAMMLTVMALGLFMNASIPRAFTDAGWVFAVLLLAIQVGRTVWTIAVSPNAFHREHFWRVLVWVAATTPLWLAGAWAAPQPRLAWWAAAVALDVVGTWLAHPVPGRTLHSASVWFDADHMIERARLFLIIALGETLLATGLAIAAAPLTAMTAATGTGAMAAATALWAIGFGRSGRLVDEHPEKSRDPIRVSRHAVNAVMIMVAGLIALAVANELTISHPREGDSVTLSLLLFAGPILFLAAQGWYMGVVLRTGARLQILGCLVLLAGGVASLALPAYGALLIAAASLVVLAVVDVARGRRRGPLTA